MSELLFSSIKVALKRNKNANFCDMIELARHIEILLLENDCVIIPDFGGFIAHYQPARYIKEENLYLPPVRTIGFNPQLTINDGLLAQSYMQAHHTDFPDATRMIEEESRPD